MRVMHTARTTHDADSSPTAVTLCGERRERLLDLVAKVLEIACMQLHEHTEVAGGDAASEVGKTPSVLERPR